MRKIEHPTEILEVRIQSINEKGVGVARYEHAPDRGSEGKKLTLFIPNVVPGDVVRVTVPNAKGRRKARLHFDELLEPGPGRNMERPIKESISGGTPLQYMTYEAQLDYKAQLVHEYFREGGFDPALISPIIGMKDPDRYRNKMDLTFGPNSELGMHEMGNYKRIIDLEDSILAPKEMVEIKHMISQWQQDYQLSGYNKETREGLLRNLMIRQSFVTKELMVALFVTEDPTAYKRAIHDLVERLSASFHDLASLLWIENNNRADTIQGDKVHVLYGRDFIRDELSGFRYRIGYDTFFQASSVQAEKMVKCALELADIHSDMRVLDLFCGIGTFSLPLAKAAKELVGIELVEQSIQSAKQNAEEAGLNNTYFFASDARKGLEELKATWETPDLLVLNPPRSGAGGKLMRSIGRYGSEKIVYISCNPKTLADDLKWLADFGYELKAVQPIDQFPHTVHVESVCLLEKQK